MDIRVASQIVDKHRIVEFKSWTIHLLFAERKDANALLSAVQAEMEAAVSGFEQRTQLHRPKAAGAS